MATITLAGYDVHNKQARQMSEIIRSFSLGIISPLTESRPPTELDINNIELKFPDKSVVLPP